MLQGEGAEGFEEILLGPPGGAEGFVKILQGRWG